MKGLDFYISEFLHKAASAVSVGTTPLHAAVISGRIDEVSHLIEKGADINEKDCIVGWTPLHWASAEGHNEIIQLLISKGADVNAKTNEGWTPLHIAREKEQTKTACILKDNGAK